MRYFTKLNATSAEALIFGYIGSGGVEAATFAKELAELKAEGVTDFTARINSPGGSVFDGLTLFNLMEENSFTVIIEGLAASIASVMALAGKPVIMRANSFLMIHNPWTFAGGDANDLKKIQENLEMIKNTIMTIYQKKTGLTTEELSAMMDDETWLSADDALGRKFIDKVDGTSDSGFANRSAAINTYYNSIFSQPNEKDKSNMLMTLLLNLFGVQAATEAEASNIVAAKVAELKNQLTKANTDLQSAQTELEQFRNRDKQVKADRIKARLDKAIQDKVIDPAERPVWENNLKDDEEGTLAILDKKKPMEEPKVTAPENRKKTNGAPDFATVTDHIRDSMKGQN